MATAQLPLLIKAAHSGRFAGVHVLAVDLGGTKVACAIVDTGGRIVGRRAEPVDTRAQIAPVKQIARVAQQLAAEAGGFHAAGIAVPGLVRRNGRVWAPNLPGWNSVPLARLLQRNIGVPIVVESDRNAAVLGETWRGAARGKSDVVVLIVGTGIGAGILAGGRLLRGAHELSGCAGWMVITEADRKLFRKIGTLEALAAGPALARAAKRKLTAIELADAARTGDRRARELFEQAGRRLGLAVANIINLFDPEVVVLGGGMAAAADLFYDELRRIALERAQPLAARQVRIAVSKLGGDANLLGMAKLALEEGGRSSVSGRP